MNPSLSIANLPRIGCGDGVRRQSLVKQARPIYPVDSVGELLKQLAPEAPG